MRTDRGVSSVVGVVLLLGITIIGTGAVVGIGSQAFADAERTATTSQAGHALTQFDSKAAIVALGESSSQRVDLGPSGDGEFVAENDSGWLRVVHHNATGNGTEKQIYNASLGSVSYRNGDTEIAYQGGGVWERRGNGSVMRSPPEFNYRRATLTLPAIRVTSEGQASGRTTAVVTQSEESRRVFPNSSASYDDGTAYDNPITTGNVTVTVQSRFYEGWADFFRTRTSGNVTVDHDNRRATVELITPDTIGEFQWLQVDSEDGLTARGKAPGHTLTEFNVTLQPDTNKNGKPIGNTFNSQEVYFTVSSGEKTLDYTIAIDKGCQQGGGTGPISVTVTYGNDTTTQRWESGDTSAMSGPFQLDCDGDVPQLEADFTSDLDLEYQGSENVTFDHEDAPDEPRTFESGDSTTIEQLSNHYVALLGDEFTVSGELKSSGSQLDKTASTGVLDYETDGRKYIAYLHVTENEIEVELE
ncbi:DUF7289 family protein [Halolamina sediminis]|uniref:DUF7289 family protein n=1 Tax=Halolamina sediminis TaxID=1480675 RepID=UPI0006B40934|nr:archaellin/type IV pilin N-terminal domain-containing protein [Halolamina sediminis]